MAFIRVCGVEEVGEGDLAEFECDGHTIVLIHPRDSELIAIQGECPHQNFPLSAGEFDGHRVLICNSHRWEFDVLTGRGIEPDDCELKRYPIKIEGDAVYVDVAG
ncbi:MAG: Rieske 2Fe-2S domain-containing protein [Desulfurellaceae bacterium]|nr:Rieske 2Fe-2S domain-containing protein [Desulfurellaceae bacterium]